MVAHQRLGQIGPVGEGKDVVAPVPEHTAQVRKVGRTLAGVIGTEIDTLGKELATAIPGGGQVGALVASE